MVRTLSSLQHGNKYSTSKAIDSIGSWSDLDSVDNETIHSSDLRKQSQSLEQLRQNEKILIAPAYDGCIYRLCGCIRGLWATRLTEDTSDNPELRVKTTIRELIVYIGFLLVLGVVGHGMVSSNMFYYSGSVENLFLDSSIPQSSSTFRSMASIDDFWKFTRNTLLDGIHSENWYNSKPFKDSEMGYIMYDSKLLGRARLRQLKVRPDSCLIHDDFKHEIKECFDMFAEPNEDRRTFGIRNGTYTPAAWTHLNASQLEAGNHWGTVGSYSGGGYVQKLGATRNQSQLVLDELYAGRWIDRGTRAVFIDFTVYNGNVNLFCVVRLLIEFPPTGGVVTSWFFRTLKLIRYVTPFDYFVLFCEVIFYLYILYYTIEEIIEIKRHRCKYFKSMFNILDIVIIITSVICCAFNVYRSVSVGAKLEALLKSQHLFLDFEFLSYWQTAFNYAIAWIIFFAWIKLFKYLSFNKTMNQLSSTLTKCAKDVAGFAVMFFIVFFAYAQLGYLLFGTQVRDYRSFIDASLTQFRIVLGDFDFVTLEQANRVLGPLYFMTYVFFVFFVLLNMFLAIITDTYSEVKSELAQQKSEFEMGDYLKLGASKLVAKITQKQHIRSLQEALQSADMNNDQRVDFSEWRSKLKGQGYSEHEIEAIFARYDSDGDRVLDAEEQSRMRKELEGMAHSVDKEIGNEHHDSGSESGCEADSAPHHGVGSAEFSVLARRVDRMEHSIGSIMSKIDAVHVKLDSSEKSLFQRRDAMSRLMDAAAATESEPSMEELVRLELARWNCDGSLSTPN